MTVEKILVGFDIGSVSINSLVCTTTKGERGSTFKIVWEPTYRRHFGKTIPLCSKILAEVESRFGKENIEKVVFTGTHGETIAKELGTFFEVETLALSYGLFELMPSSHAIISIGGHDSALFIVSPDGKGFVLEDFKLNEACAAGTGSFIDQQAERIYSDFPEFKDIPDPQLRMEKILSRFIADGKSSSRPANVACRCTVFTKSDMIHLQNKGISIGDIIAGLHEGVAKNFKSTLITNRKLRGPIAFVGGYASNELAKKAFEKTLGLEVVVPSHHTVVGALGAIISAVKSGLGKTVSSSEIANLSASSAFSASTTSPLACSKGSFVEREEATGFPSSKEKITVYLGFDIGSTTTKMVLISPSGEIYYKRYIPTEGQPVEAIKKAIKHFLESGIDRKRIDVLGVGTTGSGREVANLFVGADDVVNEVTAHAKGTTFYRPEVDTIFELGGQDAKYTLLKDGFLADFRMNKVCAAGTGSFLEETAKKLGIKINNEYENLAMSSKTPFKLAERCTVYMESDLMSFLQMGAKREDLLAGLSRAVVHNYLNRVVQDGKIGKVISFQGGPSLNKSVVAAFEAVIGKPVITLPHREVIGAIGAALHARDEIKSREAVGEKIKTKFKGWDVVEKKFVHSEEICRRNPQCHNQCKLQVYKVGEDEAIYGGECGMYESRVIVAKRTPDFSRIRQNLFFKSIEGKYRILNEGEVLPKSSSKPTIGIPRTLNFFQIGIFWVHLLEEMGFDVVISPETSNSIVDRGIEIIRPKRLLLSLS
ncbi:CoA activase [bacterium]|nr:CoA activase [bacterium]